MALSPFATSLAATNTFIGAGNTNWSPGTQWSLGHTPVSSEDVVIPGMSGYANVDASYTINSLSIQAPAAAFSYVLLSGSPLAVNNAITIDSSGSTLAWMQWNGASTVTASGLSFEGTAGTELRFAAAGALTLNGGAGAITDAGAGTSLIRLQATGVTINAASVAVDQLDVGNAGGAQSADLTIGSGQSYTVASRVFVGASATGGTHTLNLSGGSLTTPTVTLNSTGTDVFNLDAGTLTATTINKGSSVGTSQFNWNNGTIANTSGGNLAISKGSSATNLVITLAGTGTHAFDASSGQTITEQSTVNIVDKAGENGTLTKSGAGTLYLSANNTYTGATTISGGVLQVDNIGNGGALGGLSGIGHATNDAANLVFDGGTLRYIGVDGGTSGTTDRNFTVTANGGGIDASGTGLGVVDIQGSATLTGTNTARTFTFGGSSTLNNTFTGTIGDNGTGATSINKTGTGKWIFIGANSYTGNTTVSDGTLALTGGAQTAFTIGASGVNNQITGAGTVFLDGAFVFDLSGAGTGLGNSWNIVDVGTLSESYGVNFSVTGFTENAGVWSNVNGGITYTFTQTTGLLEVTAVPEPATWAFLGAGLAVLAIFRRRVRKLA